MCTISTTLCIPDEYLSGLCDGRLERIGGIIRDAATGRIVYMLKDVDSNAQNPIGSFCKEHKVLVATSLLAVAIAATASVYHIRRRKKDKAMAEQVTPVEAADEEETEEETLHPSVAADNAPIKALAVDPASKKVLNICDFQHDRDYTLTK